MGLITYDNLEDGQKVTANIFNERFAQIVAQLNGHLTAVNMEDGGITKEKLAAEVYEAIYPVGSMYVNFTDNTNPASLLGFGTWQAVAGKFIAGYDGTQTEFNAAEKTGGFKKNNHAFIQPALNSNNFQDTGSAYIASVMADINAWLDDTGSGSSDATEVTNVRGVGGTIGSNGSANTEVRYAKYTSDNLPPYIVGYVWKRTS